MRVGTEVDGGGIRRAAVARPGVARLLDLGHERSASGQWLD